MDQASFETYEQVRMLKTQELQMLLERGDPAERIWAAWAYALRRGAQSSQELARIAFLSPTAGVRRSLIVILAGHGEMEIIRIFAKGDPDPFVRATACLFLLQAVRGDDAKTGKFLLSALQNDPASEVRLTILENSESNGLVIPQVQLVALLANPDLGIRKMALEIVAKRGIGSEQVQNGLSERLDTESEADLLRMIVDLCVNEGRSSAVLSAAERQSADKRLLLLDCLIRRGVKFDWVVLDYLAGLSIEALDARILRLASEASRPLMFPWLIARLVARLGDVEWYRDDDPVWKAFVELLDGHLPLLSHDKMNDLLVINRYIGREISELEEEINSGSPVDLEEQEIQYIRAAIKKLKKAEAVIGKVVGQTTREQ